MERTETSYRSARPVWIVSKNFNAVRFINNHRTYPDEAPSAGNVPTRRRADGKFVESSNLKRRSALLSYKKISVVCTAATGPRDERFVLYGRTYRFD